ncbi:MAG TPA: hypothetical protein VFG95_09280, partial [Nitrospiria bacterium]|nr:hypothetical protein [Nitrospiria bacterium]
GQTSEEVLRKIRERSAIINRYNRVTGDAVILVAQRMIRTWKVLSTDGLNRMFRDFVQAQVLRPESLNGALDRPVKHGKSERALNALLDTVKEYSEGI